MEKIENATKEVLVNIVKLAQRRGLKGENGGWKEFLTVYDQNAEISLIDPARRTPEALIAFLKTFTNPDDLKFFDRVMEKHEILEIIDKKTDKMSPEQELVYKTVGHPQYALLYSFPSHEEGWMVTKNRKKWKETRSNAMVSVDCEMVQCEDGTDALVRVCVVDRDLQVKLDELVKPDKPVTDYRTHITGITAKDLENVTCSLQDVQESMMKLLARGTILIGHSLNNDLQVLKIDHMRVIDTYLIWSGSNITKLSLNNLCKSVLGYELRKEGDSHDCLEDARAAMKLALSKIEAGDDNNTVVPTLCPTNETDGMKLLCHRIPISIPAEKLLEIIRGDFTIESKQPNKKAGGDIYSALAVFKNKQEADEAFEGLDGEQLKDSYGRPQKLISFKLKSAISGSLYVRKMVRDGDANHNNVQVASNKRSALSEDDNPIPSKKVKTAVLCNTCDGYSKEIESLNKKLSERDQEISMLYKIIASQAKKQSES